jgi:hypothetical protein
MEKEGRSTLENRNKIDMFHFTLLKPKYTGLPVSILVEEKCSGNKEPRIIAMKKPNVVDIFDSIDIFYKNEPYDIFGEGLESEYYKQIAAWIALNKAVLLSHWKFEIDSLDLFEQIKKL